MRSYIAALTVFLVALAASAASPPAITIATEPAVPLIETTRLGQALNFDVLIKNGQSSAIELTTFEMSALDARGHLIARRSVGQNGSTIEVIPVREVPASGRLLIFNPLADWPVGVALETLELKLTLVEGENEHVIKHKITARAYVAKQSLRLPLDGAAFVHAGHDFLSHHRRFPLHSAMTDALNIQHNVTRYAYDFALVDERGEMHRGAGDRLTDWFGYGAPVLAPAAGRVVEAHDGQPDNEFGQPPKIDRDAMMKNPKLLFGNYVLIDHGGRELSMLAHLKPGSIKVKAGQQVQRGDLLAAVGMSGDASIVHLHYQMQSGPGFDEGVPVQFAEFKRKIANGWTSVANGAIGAGEIVRN